MQEFELFLHLGFDHILDGYDHILFLLGLVVVIKSWKEMLTVISAFTVAHSTTLVLSALGILNLNPTLTEVLIAASISYVGIENIVRESFPRRWIVSGSFGLIHGAGFSANLTELLSSSMTTSSFVHSLIGFNLGIEVGQIFVIALMWPALYMIRRSTKEKVIMTEISRMIAAVGLFLVIFRWFGL
jgi:hydrogenase/urease accessory protein HupE